MGLAAKVRSASNLTGALKTLERDAERRMERAALLVTKRAARIAVDSIRRDMAGARLRRLGNAIGLTSDQDKGQGVHRTPNGFRASGVIFVRSGSDRTRGAIESYTVGTTIVPRRGRWLWVPTRDIQRRTGSGRSRVRVTPGNWSKFGLDRKIGPLVLLKGIDGRPLLAVKDVGVSATGKASSARSLTKKGLARKGQRQRQLIIAFVAIPRTARTARVDVDATLRAVQAQLPALFNRAFEETK